METDPNKGMHYFVLKKKSKKMNKRVRLSLKI